MKELQTTQNEIVQYSAKDVMGQVKAIQELMKEAMHDGEHYGKIPGCGDKPTLLKAGAEKINFMFRLSAHYKITEKELQNGHREYQVLTELIHIPSGKSFGEGVGSASTMESKWRYRNQVTLQSDKLPEDYKENKNSYKEQGYIAKKDDTGKWGWYRKERIEHDNPADNYNTVLKMAKKRSLVDASLTATAASDIFTQDVEELVDNGIITPLETPYTETTQEYVQETTFEELKAEIENGGRWNGKVYKDGSIYISNKKFIINDETLEKLKTYMGE